MQAIETRYGGCLFRSRIEARWAYFFDRLGVFWEYEPQGYNLKSGPYLPDFRLHFGNHKVWWEVKGAEPTPEERRFLFDLAIETETIAYIAWGSIPRDYTDEPRISDASGNLVRWCVTSKSIGWAPADQDIVGIDSPKLLAAYTAARSARFEHAA